MNNPRTRIRHSILSQILPDHTFSFLGMGFFLLFSSPILVVLLFPQITENPFLHSAILVSFSLFFALFSSLAGIFVMGRKNPYLEEWKEKLGYREANNKK